jgi:hypothetical protein
MPAESQTIDSPPPVDPPTEIDLFGNPIPPALPEEAEEEEHTCECHECGSEIEPEDAIDVDGESHCADCVVCCEECGESHVVGSDEIHTAHTSGYSRRNTQELCDSCCWRCADCRDYFAESADSRENTSGERVCESCGEDYYTCDDCGCVLCSDDTYSNNGDGTYCESCHNDHRAESEHIHDYSYKPHPVFLRAPGESRASSLFLGAELEIDRRRESDDKSADVESAGLSDHEALYCKNDGSLENGFEIVSHPGTWQWWAHAPLAFMEELKGRDYRSYDTTTCGMHVHVSKSALSALSQLKLLEFFRRNTGFIRFIARRKDGALDQWARIDNSDRSQLVYKVKGNPGERYTAVNLCNSQTVEIRIFRGTLDQIAFRRNLAWVVSIVHFVREAGLSQLSLANYRDWLKLNATRVLGRGETAKALVKWVNSYRD